MSSCILTFVVPKIHAFSNIASDNFVVICKCFVENNVVLKLQHRTALSVFQFAMSCVDL